MSAGASTARAALHALLVAAMPPPLEVPAVDGSLGIDVLKYARDIDPPARVTVMLRHDEVERDPAAPLAQRRYTFALIILAASTTPDLVDDQLELALEEVLEVIELTASIPQWTAARRVLYGSNAAPAFEVILPFTATITRG